MSTQSKKVALIRYWIPDASTVPFQSGPAAHDVTTWFTFWSFKISAGSHSRLMKSYPLLPAFLHVQHDFHGTSFYQVLSKVPHSLFLFATCFFIDWVTLWLFSCFSTRLSGLLPQLILERAWDISVLALLHFSWGQCMLPATRSEVCWMLLRSLNCRFCSSETWLRNSAHGVTITTVFNIKVRQVSISRPN